MDKNEAKTITTFQDLDVWKTGRGIQRRLYLVANRLPDLERYNLSSQIRRAAVSLTANIAEGYAADFISENTFSAAGFHGAQPMNCSTI
jgi:hypothetical protein